METRQALEVLAAYTADQWGMVTAAQAKQAGVSGLTMHRLAEGGFLERVAHGCYVSAAAGTPPYLREKAAWLQLNPAVPVWERPALDPDGGVLSHASAARLHQVGDLLADIVEITVPRRRTTRDLDVRLRRGTLAADDVTTVDCLPTTAIDKTVSDLLAQHADGGHVGDLIYDAIRRGLTTVGRLADRVGPHAHRYGIRRDDGRALVESLLDQAGHAGELETPQLVRHSSGTSRALQDALAAMAINPAQGILNLKLPHVDMLNVTWPFRELAASTSPLQIALGPILAQVDQINQAHLASTRWITELNQNMSWMERLTEANQQYLATSLGQSATRQALDHAPENGADDVDADDDSSGEDEDHAQA